MFNLFLSSIRSRWLPTILIVSCLVSSMVLLLSIERIQNGTKQSFNYSISGVDSIIGPRSSSVALVLYTIFHIGKPTNNITYETFEYLKKRKDIDWIVPIALGDSYDEFRVIATTSDYFEKIKFGDNNQIKFDKGNNSLELNNTIFGADVAKKLNSNIGDKINIVHGSNADMGIEHDDISFELSGILKKTGTPIDKLVFINLQGYELVHLGWKSGKKIFSLKNQDLSKIDPDQLIPKTITAAFVGLKSKLTIFNFQKDIREYQEEPISAVIPSIALSELWSIVGVVDKGFKLLSWIVIIISLIAMVTLIINSLENRKREMLIYRANGASPIDLSLMVVMEALFIGLVSIILALFFVSLISYFASSQLSIHFGISTNFNFLSFNEAIILSTILLAGVLSSLLPAVITYKKNINQTFS
ncbi:MAG: ABC transporter permease [Hydrogenophilales bacterium]